MRMRASSVTASVRDCMSTLDAVKKAKVTGKSGKRRRKGEKTHSQSPKAQGERR
jgi:hypothetical protein